MNIQHLRYAVEVERQGSISKAAEILYMNQPNLSKAIRELEGSLGITIFGRSSKGVSVTREGEEFLGYARDIIAQIDQVEAHFRPAGADRQAFRVSVPRSSYITNAFTEFVHELNLSREIDLHFCETNTLQAVHNITDQGFKLGVVRYQVLYESYFLAFFNERELGHREILRFDSLAAFSSASPLAAQETVSWQDLEGMIEIIHSDLRIPNLPRVEKSRLSQPEGVRRIHVWERGSQLDLLTRNPSTFMWVAPMPREILERCGLVQKTCPDVSLRHKDVLIYPRGYSYSYLEKLFLKKLEKAAEIAKIFTL